MLITTRRTTALVGGLLAAGAVALSAPAGAAPPCQGGITAPAKGALHLVERPVSGTPAEAAVHAVECTLP